MPVSGVLDSVHWLRNDGHDALDDAELVSRLMLGDVLAYENILYKYWSALARYAFRLLDDMDAARDVSQEVFIRLWNGRAALRRGSLRSYLFQMAHNLAVDEIRKRQRRDRWRTNRALEADQALGDLSEVVERDELSMAVTSAINALPARRREVFTLAYVDQFSYHEIAAVMGISPATVKNHMAAALSQLRDALRSHLPDKVEISH